jgi:hypothetical protein
MDERGPAGSGLTAADRRLQAALLCHCRSGDAAYWLAGADGSGSLADRSSVPAMARKTTAPTARDSHASPPGQGRQSRIACTPPVLCDTPASRPTVTGRTSARREFPGSLIFARCP